MRRGIVIIIFAAILAPINANCGGSSETPQDLLIGTWNIRTSEPQMSPHHRFVFLEDKTFAIYDEKGRMIEKNIMTATTNHSFVGNIVYVSKHHPLPEIAGNSTYALYEIISKDRLKLRFYDDDTLRTLYVTFHLDRTEYPTSSDPMQAVAQESISPEKAASFGDKDLLSLVTVDFDTKMPDRTFYRHGGHLEVVHDSAINETRMGIITLPSAVPGKAPRQQPKGSFVIDFRGKLGKTITSFRTYVPGKLPYGSRSPYVVYAVTVDDDPEPEAYVVGSRIVGSRIGRRPEEAGPVGTWFECTLDLDTPVHVAGFRENLGGNFYGPLASLVKTPLREERAWGDLEIVFVEICAGVRAGPPFKAYVDDIKVGTIPPLEPGTLHSLFKKLCRELTLDLKAKGEGTIAISGFAAKDGKPSELITLLDEMVMLEVTKLGTLEIVEREQIDMILQEQSLALPDLMDTGKAVDVGKLLAADYILTGTVVEMPTSVVVFGRIINVETGNTEAIEQVNIPKSRELKELL